jgi:antitoxin component of MazEF toxin-antitoxin module
MKFSLHRTKKDCVIPSSALAVAGLKKEKELRLEVDNGVIVILRAGMDANRLLAVGAFLDALSLRMAEAVATAGGECISCGDCFGEKEYCQCSFCGSRENCRGIELPDCLLEQAGIHKDCGMQADVADGMITIRALTEDDDDDLPDGVPESFRCVIVENKVCIPNLQEILCSNEKIPF